MQTYAPTRSAPHALPATRIPAWAARNAAYPAHSPRATVIPPTPERELASFIRAQATRLAALPDDCFTDVDSEFYMNFVAALHKLCASATTASSLRWHARLALYEMGEE